MDGYKDGWMDGWIQGWMDGWMDGYMDGYMDGWMDGWMDGRTHVCMYVCRCLISLDVYLHDFSSSALPPGLPEKPRYPVARFCHSCRSVKGKELLKPQRVA